MVVNWRLIFVVAHVVFIVCFLFIGIIFVTQHKSILQLITIHLLSYFYVTLTTQSISEVPMYLLHIRGNTRSHIVWRMGHLPLDKMAAILADDIFKCIFLNENDRILIQISLKFVPESPTKNDTCSTFEEILDRTLCDLVMVAEILPMSSRAISLTPGAIMRQPRCQASKMCSKELKCLDGWKTVAF